MVLPQSTPPDQPGHGLPDHRPAAPPLTGYTVPSGWGSPPKLRTPGTVIAAAVLTYLQGGLGILVSVLLIVGGPALLGPGLSTILGVALLVLSVLYVAAALLLQLRANRAFLLGLVIANLALEAVDLIMTVAQAVTGSASGRGGSVCSLILPIMVLALLLHANTAAWVEARRRWPGQPVP
jgi:hypothetical protein